MTIEPSDETPPEPGGKPSRADIAAGVGALIAGIAVIAVVGWVSTAIRTEQFAVALNWTVVGAVVATWIVLARKRGRGFRLGLVYGCGGLIVVGGGICFAAFAAISQL